MAHSRLAALQKYPPVVIVAGLVMPNRSHFLEEYCLYSNGDSLDCSDIIPTDLSCRFSTSLAKLMIV